MRSQLTVPRRSFLAALGAATGFLASPSKLPAPLDGIPLFGEEVAAAESIDVATVCLRDDKPNYYFADEELARTSFLYQHAEESTIGSARLEFPPGDGRRFMAIECDLNLPRVEEGDSDEHVGWFTPRHLLDFPSVTPHCGNYPKGRLCDGLDAGEYYLHADEITTRQPALAKVASENAAILEGKHTKLCNDTKWWVCAEFGLVLSDPILSISLRNGVGTADFFRLEVACRIVEPTLREIARFGKGGVVAQ